VCGKRRELMTKTDIITMAQGVALSHLTVEIEHLPTVQNS
jgi:hypothetical protein